MERMVNKRLVWFIEFNNLYTNSQCGFRSQKSTKDPVVRLETSIREANIQKHLVAVFFDLEKAYETTGRYGIMKDLHNMGLRGRLPNFIKAFLTQEISSSNWNNIVCYSKTRGPSGEYIISNTQHKNE